MPPSPFASKSVGGGHDPPAPMGAPPMVMTLMFPAVLTVGYTFFRWLSSAPPALASILHITLFNPESEHAYFGNSFFNVFLAAVSFLLSQNFN